MYEKLEECPSCKHTKFTNFLICKDHSVSQESFALMRCEKCDLVFTNPRPDSKNIGKYYDSKDYISHTNTANNPINLAYKAVRWFTLKQKLNLIRQYTSERRILDFGCGSGVFVNHLRQNGYQAHGYEPHPTAHAIAKNTSKTIFSQLNQIKKQEKYAIVTAWHVLEHVQELRPTLKLLRKRLTDDGYLFIAVPNITAYDALYYQQDWAAYDVPRHLYHFNRTSFARLAKKCKLKILDIHPMKFDAYYVSLLSERYQTGNSRITKAFQIAAKSNQLARTSKDYSSLIYVLSK